MAEQFARLLAYKDEYEVARLYLRSAQSRRNSEDRRPVTYMLHPPLLRALGRKKKLKVPESIGRPLFSALHASRGLRGTPLDPFGYAGLRRSERKLIDEYEQTVRRALERLRSDNAEQVLAVVSAVATVRGFEQIKADSIREYEVVLEAAQDELERSSLG